MTTDTRPIECPRCGYDQRGEMETWSDACPLKSRCTECGLEFLWGDVMGVQAGPRWCVEYAWSVGQFYRRAAATFLRTFVPWSFWRGLQMWHACRWPHLVNYVVLLAVAVYVVFALCHGAVAAGVWRGTAGGWPGQVFVYSWGDVMRATALPFSNESPVPGAPWGWPSPRGILESYWLATAHFMSLMLLMHAVCPLVFLALPQSRRQARVRWRHIIRVTVYGLPLLLPTVLCGFAATVADAQPGGGRANVAAAFVTLTMCSVPAWLLVELVWWSTATGRFLRMRHAWGVGLAVTLIATMATLAVMLWSTFG